MAQGKLDKPSGPPFRGPEVRGCPMCHKSARSGQEYCRKCGYQLGYYKREWVIRDGKAYHVKKFIMDLV